ncbi:MAG: dihydrofolate reductase family protein [Microbacteriaceae bacterium]|nr:dihydrofolate reductase family protein [Microbacteriaceae bacterium]
MGLLHVITFATLDGVAQAPGGPQEDTDGGFEFGGWQAPVSDEVVGQHVGSCIAEMDALLLGRRTYDIWAAYWPTAGHDGPDAVIVDRFDDVPKYVASGTLVDPQWQRTQVLGPDLAAEVAALKARHEHIHVWGSLDFVQSLWTDRLVDRLDLWVFPLLLGRGKKLFGSGVVPADVTLLEPPLASPKGAVLLRYAFPDTTPGTGDMASR